MNKINKLEKAIKEEISRCGTQLIYNRDNKLKSLENNESSSANLYESLETEFRIKIKTYNEVLKLFHQDFEDSEFFGKVNFENRTEFINYFKVGDKITTSQYGDTWIEITEINNSYFVGKDEKGIVLKNNYQYPVRKKIKTEDEKTPYVFLHGWVKCSDLENKLQDNSQESETFSTKEILESLYFQRSKFGAIYCKEENNETH